MLWLSHLVFLTSKEQKLWFLSKVWAPNRPLEAMKPGVVNAIAKPKYLVTWVFRSNDGKIRYVSLEGET